MQIGRIKLKQLLKNKYFLTLLLVLTVALFFRTFGFSHRWGLTSDDTREILIAKEALSRHELPMIGPFSSAGPFVFGPIFYWFIMFSYLVAPSVIVAPWVMTILFSMANVIILILIGYLILGKRLSIIMGIIAATSAQFSFRAMVLTPHTYFATAACLLLLFFVLFWKKKNMWYPFLMGISLGLALNFHFQSINYVLFIPAILVIPKLTLKRKLLGIFLVAIGFIIPMLPLLVWDSKQGFANINNILDYIFVAQYRIYLPNSWRLFVLDYFPRYWSTLVAGYMPASLIIMVLTFLSMFYLGVRRKVSLLVYVLGFIYIAMIVINRYYRGERFEGYMIYFAPFIFLFVALMCNMFFEPKKYSDLKVLRKKHLVQFIKYASPVVGLSLIFVICYGNMLHSSNLIKESKNYEQEIKNTADILIKKYPNKTFQLYDYDWRSSERSYPLSLFLKEENKTSKNGLALVVCNLNCPKDLVLITPLLNANIYRLKNGKTQKKWVPVNREDVYDDLITRWTKDQKLTTTFSLPRFIGEKLHGN